MKQWLKEALHNCIAHPLMMFLPSKVGNSLHDKTAEWAFGKKETSVEKTNTHVEVLLERFR